MKYFIFSVLNTKSHLVRIIYDVERQRASIRYVELICAINYCAAAAAREREREAGGLDLDQGGRRDAAYEVDIRDCIAR